MQKLLRKAGPIALSIVLLFGNVVSAAESGGLVFETELLQDMTSEVIETWEDTELSEPSDEEGPVSEPYEGDSLEASNPEETDLEDGDAAGEQPDSDSEIGGESETDTDADQSAGEQSDADQNGGEQLDADQNGGGEEASEESPTLLKATALTDDSIDDFVITADGVLTSYTGTDTEVDIPEGVTAIGNGSSAVFSTAEITSVTIPSTAKVINSQAFYGMTKLATVEFAEGGELEEIKYRAFWNIAAASLTIPEGVTTIGEGAFYTDKLKSILLPATLETVPAAGLWKIFAGGGSGTTPAAGLETIDIASGNSTYTVKNGAVYDKATEETLMFCPAGKTGNYMVDSGTKKIAAYAFTNSGLNRVVIADSVTELESRAFSSTKITEVVIPGSVKKIPDNAFSFATKLKTITMEEGIEEIGASAFTEVGGTSTYTMDLVVVPASVKKIGAYAFDEISGNIKILNPSAELASSFLRQYKDTTVYGYAGSTAEQYVAVAKAASSSCKLIFEKITEDEGVAVTGVSFAEKIITLSVGDQKTLQVSVTPNDATDQTLTWSASPAGIVSLDQTGRVTALAEGSVVITAKSAANPDIFDTCNVTVTEVSDFVITGGVLTAYTGTAKSVVIPDGVTVIGDGTNAVFGSSSTAESVTIPSSVTRIANGAFYYAQYLTEINFAQGGNLTEIGSKAFSTATKIRELDLPEGVTTIGAEAFLNMHSLKRISLPSTLTSFGADGGRFDAMFVNANVSSGHNSLGAIEVAGGNPLFSSENGVVYSADGKTLIWCPQAKTGTLEIAADTEIIAPYAFSLGRIDRVIFADTVTKLSEYAFYKTGLTAIALPGSIEEIGDYGFALSQLRSVTLPEGLEHIGKMAFYQSRITGVRIPSTVTFIGSTAFDFDYGTNYWIYFVGDAVELGDEFIPYYYSISVYASADSDAAAYVAAKQAAKGSNCKLTLYDRDAFIAVTGISLNKSEVELKRSEKVTLTAAVEPVNSRSTLIGWSSSNLAVATVDSSGVVTAVQTGTAVITAVVDGKSAACTVHVVKDADESDFVVSSEGIITGFIGSDVSSVIIPEEVNGVAIVGIADGAFAGKTGLKTLVIPGTVKTIGKKAFYGCSSLESLTLNTGIGAIGEEAFSQCAKLKNVVIPEGIEALSGSVFAHCFGLESVTLPSTLKTIGEKAFFSCKISSVTLSEGLQSIGAQAFYNCPLTTLHLPASLTKMGAEYIGEVFEVPGQNPANTAMKSITVAAGSGTFSAYDGLLYDKSGTTVLFAPRGMTEASVREGATRIGDKAFFMCFDLETVTLPSTLKSIGLEAFHYCEALKNCTLPEGLEAIEKSAFFGCESWAGVVIPSTVTSIGAYAFVECLAEEIRVPEGITRIEEYTFWGYEESLKRVILPSTLTYIGDSAFSWAKLLEEIEIPEGVTEIGKQAFARCDMLKRVMLPSTLRTIGAEAFQAPETGGMMTEIYIPGSVASIGSGAFKNHGSKLAIVTDAYESPAAAYATANGHGLRIENENAEADFTVVDGVLTAYTGTNKEIVIPNTVTEIGEGVFREVEGGSFAGIKKVVIPASVTKIGKDAFHGSGVTEVIFLPGSGLSIIDESAFSYCTKLPAIELPGSLTKIGAHAFEGASLLGKITIPASVISLEDGAFNVCTGLRSVTFETPSQLRTIGAKAFYNCFRLTELAIPEGVVTIGNQAINISKTLVRVVLPSTVTELGTSVPEVFGPVTDSNLVGSDSLKEVIVAEGNSVYSSADGCVYTKDGKTLLFIPAGKSGTVTVQEGTSAIGNYAAVRGKLDHIALPESLKTIGEYVFTNSSLSSVEIPAQVESIGKSAFFFCTKLKQVTMQEGLKTISYNSFSLSPLRGVSIPASVESVGKYSFDEVQGWVKVNGAATVLEGEFIPDSSELIVYGEVESTAEQYVAARKAEKGTECKLTFAPLSGFVSVSSIRLSHSALDLLKYETSVLTAEVLPENATHKDLVFKSLNSAVATVAVDGTVTAVGVGTTKILVLSTDGASAYCSVRVSTDSTISDYTVDREGTITGYYGSDTSLVFPEMVGTTAVTGIAAGAFRDNKEIREITLHSGISQIGDDAFNGCTNLGELRFAEGLEYIGDRAFYNCTYLTEVVLPNGLSGMGEGAFTNCEMLERVTIPGTLSEIPKEAFMTCWRLLHLELPEGVVSIGENAFYECEGMETLTLPNSLRTIGKGAFTACVSLEIVEIPEGVVSIDKEAFMSCAAMTSLSLPATLTRLGSVYPGDSFEQNASVTGCNELQMVTVAEGNPVYSSYDGMLYSADGKTLLFCPRGRTNAVVKEGTANIGDSAFFFCLALQSVTLPESLRSIDRNAFHLCKNLKEIKLPAQLETIGASALAECTGLSKLEIPGAVTSIGTFALGGLNIESIELPASVKTLGDRVFDGSMGLRKVTILSGVTEIGTNLLGSCKDVKIITDSKESAIYRYAATNNLTVEVMNSGGDDGNGSSRSKSDDKKTVTTEKTTDLKTGAVTEIKTLPDGTKEKIVTQKDGTVLTAVEKPDGSVSSTETRPDGTKIVTETSSLGKTTANVILTSSSKRVAITIPMTKSPSAGFVAVIVNSDGTREILKDSIPSGDGISFTLTKDATIEIVENSREYADVAASAWYADSIAFMTARELFAETEGGQFSPNEVAEREWALTALALFAGLNSQSGTVLDWAQEKGISDGENSDRAVSREELITMIYRFAGGSASSDSSRTFADEDDISGWAKDAVHWAAEKNLITGKGGGMFDPAGKATRAEIAAVIQRFITEIR